MLMADGSILSSIIYPIFSHYSFSKMDSMDPVDLEWN